MRVQTAMESGTMRCVYLSMSYKRVLHSPARRNYRAERLRTYVVRRMQCVAQSASKRPRSSLLHWLEKTAARSSNETMLAHGDAQHSASTTFELAFRSPSTS